MSETADGAPGSNFYFTADTDAALAEFIRSPDRQLRVKVFVEKIKPAFEKLIENIIFVYGFYGIDDVDTMKRDCLANLYEMIPKFDPDRGKKGFSYFNVVARNWFIQRAREKAKRERTEESLSEPVRRRRRSEPAEQEDDGGREFLESLHEEMDAWRELPLKKTEKQVLEGVSFLLRNPDLVSIYNRKAVYIYLRELTGLTTKQVVVNLKKIRELYEGWKKKPKE